MVSTRNLSFVGSVFAFLLATSCCWLPWLAVLLGSSLVGTSAFSARLEAFSGPLLILSFGMLSYGIYSFWKKRKRQVSASTIVLQSFITCPECGFGKMEIMPTDACQFFYECENCRRVLKPQKGDCCVFCSYGTVKCPPIQEGKGCC